MPRSILGAKATGPTVQGGAPANPRATGLSEPGLDQRLRQRRSQAYLDAARRLDAGTHHQNKAALDSLIDAIAAEFPDITIEERPVGLVSCCYLGPPFVVHMCDVQGNIVEHFEGSRAMPQMFERARTLALHGKYAFIEVYPASLRAIAEDGTVAVVQQ